MIERERERELLRRRLLGRGLACDPIAPGVDLGRDLRVTQGTDGTDFAMVDGIYNLGQSLAIGLTTLRGSDIFNLDFGFDGLNAMVEETNPVLVRERVRVGVIQLLRKDPRVRRIVDVKLGDGRLDGVSAGSRELDVRVAFETVSGEQMTVDLGQVTSNG
jgi:phage baseplate assembly protein W